MTEHPIKGTLELYGALNTNNLTIESVPSSANYLNVNVNKICAGHLKVADEFILDGVLQLNFVKSDLTGRYIKEYTICQSDVSTLDVGKISGNGEIHNEGCQLNIGVHNSEVQLHSKDFKSATRQLVVDAEQIPSITAGDFRNATKEFKANIIDVATSSPRPSLW